MNKTKDFLYNSIDKGVSNLETVKAWIEKVNISQDQKDTLTLELDQHIANLNSLKRDVDDIVIKIQAVDAARKIRSEWQYAKKTIKKSVGLAISARTALVTNQLSTLSNRLQSRVDALKADNKDISKIQPLIDKFDEKLSLATQDYNAANAKFQAISDSQDENKVMQQGMELLRSAHQDLKDAQGILVQIVKEFRALNTPIDTELNRTSTAIGEDS